MCVLGGEGGGGGEWGGLFTRIAFARVLCLLVSVTHTHTHTHTHTKHAHAHTVGRAGETE